MEWTESATMALVDEWQKYPCLYDVKSDDYHNRVLKSTAMQTIATILKTTGYRRSPPICTLLDAILLQLVAVDILSSLVKLRCNKLRSKTRATSVSSDMGLREICSFMSSDARMRTCCLILIVATLIKSSTSSSS